MGVLVALKAFIIGKKGNNKDEAHTLRMVFCD